MSKVVEESVKNVEKLHKEIAVVHVKSKKMDRQVNSVIILHEEIGVLGEAFDKIADASA